MGRVVAGLIEEHIAQPPTQDHAEDGEEDQVVELLARDRRRGVPDALQAEPPRGGESGEIHEPVPAHGERADGERDRVEVRVKEHERYALRRARLTKERGAAESSPRCHASHRSSRGCRSASSRYATPRRPRLETEAGTMATPRPLDTRLTTVCIWMASCATLSGIPARAASPRTISYRPGAISRGTMTKGSPASSLIASRPASRARRCLAGSAATNRSRCTTRWSKSASPSTGGRSSPKSSSPAPSAVACSGESISRSASVTPGRAALNPLSSAGSMP